MDQRPKGTLFPIRLRSCSSFSIKICLVSRRREVKNLHSIPVPAYPCVLSKWGVCFSIFTGEMISCGGLSLIFGCVAAGAGKWIRRLRGMGGRGPQTQREISRLLENPAFSVACAGASAGSLFPLPFIARCLPVRRYLLINLASCSVLVVLHLLNYWENISQLTKMTISFYLKSFIPLFVSTGWEL